MRVAKFLNDKTRKDEKMNLPANTNPVGENKINFRTQLPVGDESYLSRIQNMILRTNLRNMVQRIH